MTDFVRNFPFFCIMITMFSGIISSVMPGRWAKRLTFTVIAIDTALSFFILSYVYRTGASFTYIMGHFPAPWGNEIRAGLLEGLMAVSFCLIMLFCLLGGQKHIQDDIEPGKENLYYIMIDLLLSSLLALIYTNDLFTAYVFVEINTISACGLIMIRQTGRSFVAAARYMVMSLLGSGLFLIGISLLYDLTGHLLMPNLGEAVAGLVATGRYNMPLTVTIALMSVGLMVKSGLYPFHTWIPESYGYSTTASSAILSSLVSKGYIILLVKIFYRILGIENVVSSRLFHILFVFGLVGMIMGSVSAIAQNDIRTMTAFSSVAQIGYIYMGIGLGTTAGMVAALFHVISHGATKALLFVSAGGLSDCSDKSKRFSDLQGAGFRNVWAGIGFTVGAFSMVGLPMFAGFISKLLFSNGAVQSGNRMLPALIVLAVSTVLNAVYFLRTVIRIYTPNKGREYSIPKEHMTGMLFKVSIAGFLALNLVLGMWSDPIVSIINRGLELFS